ncbi:unnamed protein product, partial [marine sediment metagenome]
MVSVVNATGLLVGANTAIDLSPYLEGDIANLVGVRTLVRSVHTVTFFGTPMPAHSHAVETAAAHSHAVESEAGHSHPYSITGSTGGSPFGAGHSHLISVTGAGAFTPTTDAQAAYAPTTDAVGGLV